MFEQDLTACVAEFYDGDECIIFEGWMMCPRLAFIGRPGQLMLHSLVDAIAPPFGMTTFILFVVGQELSTWEFTARK